MRETLVGLLTEAIRQCKESGELKAEPFPPITLEIPRREGHGDFASPVAMILGRAERKSPRQVAEILKKRIAVAPPIERVEVAGGGYLNFFLFSGFWHDVLREVREKGDRFGRAPRKGKRIQVEFVSANPTGPLHVGHGRGAALGDALACLLEAVGYDVEREYYINDIGNQMETLGKSVFLRYRDLCAGKLGSGSEEISPLPEGYYQGEYIVRIAREAHRREGDRLLADEAEGIATLRNFAAGEIMKGIRKDLEQFRVRFDHWFSESSLYEKGEVASSLEDLEKRGLAYEREGALFIETTRFGDDKDRVALRAQDRRPTYFASDIAYHKNKFDRGFDEVIDVWGADHHGYVPRMKAALAAFLIPPERLSIILVQLVNLLRDGKPVAMSTRGGEFVTLADVVDEVGVDAARFMFLTRRSDTPLDFDLEIAKKQSLENPVYYVQYAHARVCSVIRFAEEHRVEPGEAFHRLTLPEERALLRYLSFYPGLIESAAGAREPHRLTFYLQEVAGIFHNYYYKHRVIADDIELSAARLALVEAVRIVLANALSILGVSAPERM